MVVVGGTYQRCLASEVDTQTTTLGVVPENEMSSGQL